MDINSFQKLIYFEQYYADPINGIPEKSGIYYWVYWPSISNTPTLKNLEIKLLEYSKNNLLFSETISGNYKFQATISEQWYRDNGNIFGLTNAKKDLLYAHFKKDPKNIKFFLEFFKQVCFSRPFYIGKANNLRTRLAKQHFKGTTEIMAQISKSGIPKGDIYVGFDLINDAATERVNVIFEEIFSRKIKPGLTKKPN